MKVRATVIAGAVTLAWLAGPGFAQTSGTPAAPPATPAAPAKPAESAKPAAKPKTLTAEVVSVNKEAGTLVAKATVEGKATEMTFTADKGAAATLADLKAGEQVRVTYLDAEGKRTATAIARVAKPATK